MPKSVGMNWLTTPISGVGRGATMTGAPLRAAHRRHQPTHEQDRTEASYLVCEGRNLVPAWLVHLRLVAGWCCAD